MKVLMVMQWHCTVWSDHELVICLLTLLAVTSYRCCCRLHMEAEIDIVGSGIVPDLVGGCVQVGGW